MLRSKNHLLPLILGLVLMGFNRAPADVFDEVCRSMQNGDAAAVSKYFGSNVELELNGKEGVYSKQQAEVILRDFFSKNPGKTVSISHRSTAGSEKSFIIATYSSQNGNVYRVTMYAKNNQGQLLIEELKFEKS